MAEPTRNELVIAEFRANQGVMGGDRPGRPVLLLTTVGRKTGTVRTTPVLYLVDGSRYHVFASHGGSPEDPDWYLNLMAAQSATVEVPGATFTAVPVQITGTERGRIYEIQCGQNPQFREYQERTSRQIPVVALDPIA